MRKVAKAVVCLLLLGLAAALMGATPADRRGYVGGRFALELDGVVVGWLFSADGGYATSEVVTEWFGPGMAKKHLAGVKYEDITITAGAGMSKAFYDWISSTLAGSYPRKNGAIIAVSFDSKETSRLEFSNALITEIGMPALDAASKDAAKMTIKFTPERTRLRKSAGERVKLPGDFSKQKTWLPSNFRLRIDGLEQATSRVNKIEAITIKQKVIENAVGFARDYEKEPASVEIPNLVITFPESHADSFYDWHQDFVISGNNGEGKEKSGTLEYLSPDLKEVLFRLEFHNLGIFKLAPDKVESGAEQIRRVKAEMYCEDMSFSVGSAMIKSAPQQVPAPPATEQDPEPKPKSKPKPKPQPEPELPANTARIGATAL
ncbi:MAG TPA: phage tail protein [Symbiobacteriaceae bacterium]|nr:phage tail protein [Symbiobacteriaceae bacterium]